ncbi:MAG: CaiB/BaiF CoA-transferase family protein [Chloroflexi bacterium]|nr:CaiB/BaiF CoA-transferase family protein [Chloroflexota bacterium]
MTLPLEGFRMLDLSRLVPGPMATWLLADLGMDVLKVEEMEVARGGRARDSFSPTVDDPELEARAMAWNHTARNKQSIAINLRDARGQEILHKLVAKADVFFGTYRMPVYERLGADYETLKEINPRLIYCTLSGYGQEGTYADWPGQELNAQGLSGVSALSSGGDGEPANFLFTVVDNFSAAIVAISIQAALFARERTGTGQVVDIAITEAGTTLINQSTVNYFRHGRIPKRGVPGLGSLRCKDGKYLSNAASAETHFWDRFCDAIDRPQYKGMFPLPVATGDGESPDVKIEEAISDVRGVMLTKTRDEWMQIIPLEISVVPMLELDEALDGGYAQERGTSWELDHPLEGKVRQLSSPFHLSDTPPTFRNFAPMLGEHTTAVLMDIGYSQETIRQLATDKVVRIAPGVPSKGQQ